MIDVVDVAVRWVVVGKEVEHGEEIGCIVILKRVTSTAEGDQSRKSKKGGSEHGR